MSRARQRGPAGGAGRDAPRRVLVVRCPAGPALTARDLAAVTGVIEGFCPQVEVLHPGTWAIAARGPARYFGGEESLAAQICAATAGLGIGSRTGVADGLFAALLAAGVTQSGAGWPPPGPGGPPPGPGGPPRPGKPSRTGGPPGAVAIVPPGGSAAFLAPFDVAVLEIPPLTLLLPRLGLGTLGEFATLPAAEAAGRFGAQGALAHRLARGLAPRPLAPRPPPDDLAVTCEFDPPEPQSEPVVFAAKTLAGQMHASLAARGLACVRVKVQVISADGRELTRLWRHDGLLSALAVAERVRWQLDGWPPAPPAGPPPGGPTPAGLPPGGLPEDGLAGGITLLRLVPDQLVRDHGRQLGLWGDAVVSDRVARAAIRVQAMLGPGAVTRPVLTGGRSPRQQVQLVPFGDAPAAARPADRPWPGQMPAPAPAACFAPPRPARVTDHRGALIQVDGRAQLSGIPARLSLPREPPREIVRWAGPWPVAERWWDPARACRQARFQLITGDGAGWLAVVQDGFWLIEGCYC